MRTLRLHAAGRLELHDEPDPAPADGEVLVRMTAIGLCGSDRHWFAEGAIGDAGLSRPLVLGHELAGVVAAGPREGERVALDPADPCGRCTLCREGLAHLCLDLRFAGHGATDGGLRTLMAWPGELAHPIPDGLPDAQATLLEPLGVALHAVDLGKARSGTRAGVFGCGPVGLLLVQALRAAGARVVVATDELPHRIEAAAAAGAEHALPAGDPSLAGLLEGYGDGLGLDVAFEAAGEDGAVDEALEALRPGGRLVLVGIPDGDRTSFRASLARRKAATILLSRRMTAADLPRAIGLVEAGAVELGPLVTDRYPLEAGAEAFGALVHRRGLKVVVEPQAAR